LTGGGANTVYLDDSLAARRGCQVTPHVNLLYGTFSINVFLSS
jgi:hypothetical protein